jgi:xylose dehydrogenase (NAD/NADP)
MVTTPVRWGLLSTAAINGAVVEGCVGSALVELAAVGSRNLERARTWASARGIANVHGSYESLLDDSSIDAIYISVPNSLHIPWVVRALEAGKHVLCEKPLSGRREAVAEAFNASERAGRLLAEAFMYRFHPQTAQVRTLLAERMIGPVRWVRSTHSFAMDSPATDVRLSTALDGGALMDVGCYCVSAFRLFAGEPICVTGHAIRAPSGVDLRFAGTLVAADGATGQFDCAMDLPRRNGLEIVGSDGSIWVPDPWHCRGAPLELRAGRVREKVATSQQSPYRSEFEAVSRAIRGDIMLEFGRDDALAQAAVLEALQSSAAGGVAREIPVLPRVNEPRRPTARA